jgi:hypothetical protein
MKVLMITQNVFAWVLLWNVHANVQEWCTDKDEGPGTPGYVQAGTQ